LFQISVIIPTYNRLDRLKRVLEALERQSYPFDQYEVIVVSDGSTDGTFQYLNELKTPLHLRAVQQTNLGAAAARNLGFRMARAELILFLDDDVVPTAQWIAEHVQAHTNHGPGCVVVGPMLTPPDSSLSPWVQWEQDKLEEQYEAMLSGRWEAGPRQFYTGNTSLERRYLLESGGFDPQFRRAEDVELAYRLMNWGLIFVFNPQAVGFHYAERTFDSWLRTPYAYGRNDVIFTEQKGQTWLLPQIFNEFYNRHVLVQALTKLSLDRRLFAWLLKNCLALAITTGQILRSHVLSGRACSALFNLIYYQGVTDELGGRKRFEERLSAARQRREQTETIAKQQPS
jgi:GT2 family glycosyltransferase